MLKSSSGINGGRNCTRLESELMHSLCRTGSRRSCQNATRSLGAGDGVLAEDILEYHAMRIRTGQGMQRRGHINGGDEYHERMEREERERRRP